MLRRLFYVLILIPVAIVLIALTVANRHVVSFSIDVFNPNNPLLRFDAPLFVWLYASAAIGMIVGGIGTWLTQATHRRNERALKREKEELRFEIEDTKRRAGLVDESAGQALVMRR